MPFVTNCQEDPLTQGGGFSKTGWGRIRADTVAVPFQEPSMSTDPSHAGQLQAAGPAFAGLRVGIDTVEIADVEASLRHFGPRYAERIYTRAERRYAESAPAMTAARLAARFAAKEAAIKALNLSEAGVSWCDIEVLRSADGACHLVLHGRAAAWAARGPALQTALSLSHDGTHAVAVLACLPLPGAHPATPIDPTPSTASDPKGSPT